MGAKKAGRMMMDAIKNATMSMFKFLEMKSYRMLDILITLTKRGNSSWSPTFEILYKQAIDANLKFTFPGMASFKAAMHMTQRYDISEVFNELWHAFTDNQD